MHQYTGTSLRGLFLRRGEGKGAEGRKRERKGAEEREREGKGSFR